jgi:hypothetical protein
VTRAPASEHVVEESTLIEGAEIREATDRLTVDEDLRNARTPGLLDEPATQRWVAPDVDSLEDDPLGLEESQG